MPNKTRAQQLAETAAYLDDIVIDQDAVAGFHRTLVARPVDTFDDVVGVSIYLMLADRPSETAAATEIDKGATAYLSQLNRYIDNQEFHAMIKARGETAAQLYSMLRTDPTACAQEHQDYPDLQALAKSFESIRALARGWRERSVEALRLAASAVGYEVPVCH